MKKLQIWLRLDQAECAAAALEYVSLRFQEHGGKIEQHPAVVLACELADHQAKDVHSILVQAIAKVRG